MLPAACALAAGPALPAVPPPRWVKRRDASSDSLCVRLVACQDCHTQYDVSQVVDSEITCRCGARIANRAQAGAVAAVARCASCGAQVAGDSKGCDYCGAAIVRAPRKLSLICPECHARNPASSRFCTACGVGFDPEAVKIEGVELPCPCCGGLMPVRPVGGIGVNECGACNGLWVPGERLDHLIGRAVEARRRSDPTGFESASPRVAGSNPARQQVHYRKCPVCEAFMQRRNFRRCSGVIIDRCHEHGTWLDADELEQITGFLLSGAGPGPETRPAGAAARTALSSRTRAELAAAGLTAPVEPAGTERGLVGSLVEVLNSLLG